jgi:hypothetical protein
MSHFTNILTNELLGKEGQSYREHCGGYGDINRAETGLTATVMWGVFIQCANYGKNASVNLCRYGTAVCSPAALLQLACVQYSQYSQYLHSSGANDDSGTFPSQLIAVQMFRPSGCPRT